jgi:hypothetical protein
MKALIIVLAILLSGCAAREAGQTEEDIIELTTSTVETATTQIRVAQETTTSTVETATTLDEPTTTTNAVEEVFDVIAWVDGCDEDYYGNAMVAGFVENRGHKTASNVEVLAVLMDADSQAIDDGQKRITVDSLKPGETRGVSQVFISPGEWEKCALRLE